MIWYCVRVVEKVIPTYLMLSCSLVSSNICRQQFYIAVGSQDDRQESQRSSSDEIAVKYPMQPVRADGLTRTVWCIDQKTRTTSLSEWGRWAEAKCRYKINLCMCTAYSSSGSTEHCICSSIWVRIHRFGDAHNQFLLAIYAYLI
jgi:hypothetical protein